MGADCAVDNPCGPDMRPFMTIRVIEATDVAGLEKNHESHAYCELSYGRLDTNRYEINHSKHIETSNGYVYWDDTIKFRVGSLYATQSLKVDLKDHNYTHEDNLIGSCIIYFGSHPANDSISDNNPDYVKRSASVYQNFDSLRKCQHKYFLPLEWFKTEEYKLEMTTNNNGCGGIVHLEVTFIDRRKRNEYAKYLKRIKKERQQEHRDTSHHLHLHNTKV